MIRSSLFTRTALALALSLGVAGGSLALSAPALAKEKKEKAPAPAKLSPTKSFMPVYNALKTTVDGAGKRADVVAARAQVTAAENALRNARGTKPRADAKAAYDASIAALGGLLSGEKAQLETASAAIGNADDKYIFGQLALSLGNVALDKGIQRRGLTAMIDSGKVTGPDLGKFNYYVGGLAYDMREFAAARTAFQAAIAAGHTDNDIQAMLAETYISENNPVEGLKVLRAAVDARGSAAAPEDWLRKGVVVGYKAKLPGEAAAFSSRLVASYPTTDNWALAIAVVRDLNKFQNQEQLDLMRLMGRTNSYAETRDYIEYVQAADPRRLPGEALKVLNLGLASGKLTASDIFVSDSKAIATGRIAADKTSLAGLERDARAANATAATAMAAGDAYLSYEDAAKAEALYTIALSKPGVDTARVLTRLGIAQADLGKLAEAQATFAKVDGVRAPIAQLWSAYVRSKAAPAVAAAAN